MKVGTSWPERCVLRRKEEGLRAEQGFLWGSAVCWEHTNEMFQEYEHRPVSLNGVGNNECQFLLPGVWASSSSQCSALKPVWECAFLSESSYLTLLSSVKAAILIPPSEEESKNTSIWEEKKIKMMYLQILGGHMWKGATEGKVA